MLEFKDTAVYLEFFCIMCFGFYKPYSTNSDFSLFIVCSYLMNLVASLDQPTATEKHNKFQFQR